MGIKLSIRRQIANDQSIPDRDLFFAYHLRPKLLIHTEPNMMWCRTRLGHMVPKIITHPPWDDDLA